MRLARTAGLAGWSGGAGRQLGSWRARSSGLTPASSVLASEMGRKKGRSGAGGAEEGNAPSGSGGGGGDVRADSVTALRDKQTASLERLKKDLATISAGRASPELLARVTVDAHGVREPLSKVAQIAVKDHQTLVANVFDPSLVKAVATAIAEAELQLNPQVLGSSVKMAVPRVTKEYRDTLAKRVTDAGEEAKVALRKHRHEVLGAARKAKDALSKDDMFRLEEELTKQTKAAEKAVSEQIDRKTKEVLKE